MSIFICWSKDRSFELAKHLKILLDATLPSLPRKDIFVSSIIEKGVTWFGSIERELERAEAGIVCLTPENLDSHWLHFEAGALARRLSARDRKGTPSSRRKPRRRRLFTLLLGDRAVNIEGPLAAYQATNTTQADMNQMMRSLVDVLGAERVGIRRSRKAIIAQQDWATFIKPVGKIAVDAHTLIRGLEQLFQRKTFTEPVHHCTDQAWLRRCDRARETRAQLATYQEQVKAACPRYQQGLFDMLLGELDGYSMAMESLLLQPRRFKLSTPGELMMPPATRTCCEDRRLAIRSLSARLIHSREEPLRPEAVSFLAAETNEERKMIVHGLEGPIRQEREAVFEKRSDPKDAIKKLTSRLPDLTTPIDCRASSWDLDRIFYYLLVEYFRTSALRWDAKKAAERDPDAPPKAFELICAARDVEMEEERYRAKSKGGSLMPVTYALRALQELGPARVQGKDRGPVTHAIESAVKAVRRGLTPVLPKSEGSHIAELIANLESVLRGLSGGPPAAAVSRATAARAARRARPPTTADPSRRPRPAPRGRRTSTLGR